MLAHKNFCDVYIALYLPIDQFLLLEAAKMSVSQYAYEGFKGTTIDEGNPECGVFQTLLYLNDTGVKEEQAIFPVRRFSG